MPTEPIVVRGTSKDLALLAEALADADAQFDVDRPAAIKQSLTGRKPMGQVELFDVAIHFATSLAAHVAFEAVKAIVSRLKRKGADLSIMTSKPPKNTPAKPRPPKR